jgi:hypothetical protein
MCMEEIDIKYRKRGEKALSYLSKDTKCFFKVFACVDGTDGLGNGIARIILTYIGGENMREKLMGVRSSRSEVLKRMLVRVDNVC